MIRFEVIVDCDNEAFEGDNLPVELSRLLREVARWVENGDFSKGKKLTDSNGNRVGRAALVEE